ncbi:MAG TPA: RagB/SusD family nutrient uptake outer membrane protein [Chitinophagaceae bacterium]|nr:RagB/SusD family nutrient uptake outer membrane protein [Chitinophagaceae bacterium]
MKKYFLPFVVASAVFCSCSKEFLEQQPISNVATTNFFRTQTDFQQALTGAYNGLLSTGVFTEFYNFAEIPSDNVLKLGTGTDIQLQFSQFSVDATNPYLSRAWNDHYAVIQRLNTVLSRIDAASFDATAKKRIVAEAKFLRALMYFNLVRIFGPVPLSTTEVTTVSQAAQYERTPTNEVYAQIIKDLSESEVDLPKQVPADYGRATRGAAKSLLGKVYLTQRNWQAAANKLKEVIDLNDYSLVPEYASLFQTSTENNSEVIFAAQYQAGLFPNSFPQWFSPLGSSVFGGVGRGDFTVTAEMANSYEPNDKRKAASIDSMNTTTTGLVRYTKKYAEGYNNSGTNWIVLRYADVLLMYAEALNELGYVTNGPAFTYYNLVRQRAGLPPRTSTTLPDQASFRVAVEQERRIELAYEGHRWFDLVRTNRAVAVINSKRDVLNIPQPITQTNLLFPVPQDQILLNPSRITQNPGY